MSSIPSHPFHKFTLPYTLEVDGACETARADVLGEKVTVHPLVLISPDEIPQHLRLSGPDDPRLSDPIFIASLKTWVAKKTGVDELELKNFEKILKFYVTLWEQPDMAKRMLEFGIAHEMGHIAGEHVRGSWETFFAYCLSIALICTVSPFLYGVWVSFAVGITSYQAFRCIRLFSERSYELDADQYALKLTGDFEAGEALLRCIDKAQREHWENTPLSSKITTVLFRPEIVFPISHPSPTARIENLRNFKG